MVESHQFKDIYNHLISELKNATNGAYIYAKEALLKEDFREFMVEKLDKMRVEIENKVKDLDSNGLEEVITLLYEQKKVVE